MSDTKNDIAWKKLFEKHKIIESVEKEGHFFINSKDINLYREARLMTKFDYKSQLPELFSKNELSILPISRGGYIISTFSTFQDFDTHEVDIQKVNFPNYIESIDYNNITSESTALNCAYISGIIEDFTEDEELKPAVNGRMSSRSFDFNINAKKGQLNINVENSQIEIDGGYEGVNSLSLIEAKNSISKDFLIRQLYYPYKLWSNKITKKVRPLFLIYTNGIFHFREYSFEDPDHYNSLKLIRQRKYIVREGAINLELIQKTLNESIIVSEPEIPFPQADSFERVINLCELLNERIFVSQEEITENYDFDKRQTDSFIGLPTPANALMIASFPLITAQQKNLAGLDTAFVTGIINNPWFLIIFILVFSSLLVAGLPLMSLKFKTFRWGDNKVRYLFLMVSVILFILLFYTAVPLIIVFYVLLSLFTR
jgi:hypothetical protein